MLFALMDFLSPLWRGFAVFHYLSLRTILSVLTAFGVSLLVGPLLIRALHLRSIGQNIRALGPESHHKKAGTPTMGGVLILIAVGVATLLWSDLSNRYVWVVLVAAALFAGIGSLDDYRKLVHDKGLSARSKIFWQVLCALGISLFLYRYTTVPAETQLFLPFLKNFLLELGWWFVPFSVLIIVGSSNAVNLSDGLDGLVILPVVVIGGALGLIAYLVGNANFSAYLHIPYIPGTGELAIFCAALAGAGLGFLWFNAYPAQLFMGDVGSLSLGAVLGLIAVLVRHEVVFFCMAGVFVLETLSVMIQVGIFRLTGKRFFLMAPVHHHFELQGQPESRIIVRFWIVTILLVLCSLATLKLR